jgi:hypothetical protein
MCSIAEYIVSKKILATTFTNEKNTIQSLHTYLFGEELFLRIISHSLNNLPIQSLYRYKTAPILSGLFWYIQFLNF